MRQWFSVEYSCIVKCRVFILRRESGVPYVWNIRYMKDYIKV